MAMTYANLLSYAENIMVDASPSTDFSGILPAAIQQTENDLYRKLDLLSCRGADTTVTLSTSTRAATCPSTISVVEGISLLSPAGDSPPNATRIPLERASLGFIDGMYGDETVTAQPIYFAMKSDTAIVVAPTSSSAYKIEITGTVQPTPMSASNQTSFLGNQFPDLLLAGVILFLCGWQQNYGSASDNPQMAVSWKSVYDGLLGPATEYVQRQKSQDPGWNPLTPTPLAAPRG